MAKLKMTEELHSFLRQAYTDAVIKEFKVSEVTKEVNMEFFKSMRRTEALADATDPQMRASLLMEPRLYIAHAPRVEPKAKGPSKAELLAELEKVSGVELQTGTKLNMADIEALTAAFNKVNLATD